MSDNQARVVVDAFKLGQGKTRRAVFDLSGRGAGPTACALLARGLIRRVGERRVNRREEGTGTGRRGMYELTDAGLNVGEALMQGCQEARGWRGDSLPSADTGAVKNTVDNRGGEEE